MSFAESLVLLLGLASIAGLIVGLLCAIQYGLDLAVEAQEQDERRPQPGSVGGVRDASTSEGL